MKSEVRVLSQMEIQQISGGHPSAALGAFGIAILIAEIPHMIVGFREFVNYVGQLWVHGCDNVEEDDYFSRGICAPYTGIKGLI